MVKAWLLSSTSFWVVVYASTFLGCCRVVLATLGPRTTLSCLVDLSCVHLIIYSCHPVVFISSPSCGLFVLLRYAVVGLQTIESRIRGQVCLRKLVFGANQIELDYWISSPQPLKGIGKGSQGMSDCEAEKGLIPIDACVDVLEVRLALG